MLYLHPQSLGYYRRHRHRCVRNFLIRLDTCITEVVLRNIANPTCLDPAPAAFSCLFLCPAQSCCSLLMYFKGAPPSLQHFEIVVGLYEEDSSAPNTVSVVQPSLILEKLLTESTSKTSKSRSQSQSNQQQHIYSY